MGFHRLDFGIEFARLENDETDGLGIDVEGDRLVKLAGGVRMADLLRRQIISITARFSRRSNDVQAQC